jgi:hypothetical protein
MLGKSPDSIEALREKNTDPVTGQPIPPWRNADRKKEIWDPKRYDQDVDSDESMRERFIQQQSHKDEYEFFISSTGDKNDPRYVPSTLTWREPRPNEWDQFKILRAREMDLQNRVLALARNPSLYTPTDRDLSERWIHAQKDIKIHALKMFFDIDQDMFDDISPEMIDVNILAAERRMANPYRQRARELQQSSDSASSGIG